jgi:hypothetical protein
MAIRHEIDPDKRILSVYATHDVTIPELTEYLITVLKDPLYESVKKALYDFSDVGSFKFDVTHIGHLFQLTRGDKRIIEKPRAIVVSGDLHYGFARMAAGYAELRGITLKIFTDKKKAEEWLGEQ